MYGILDTPSQVEAKFLADDVDKIKVRWYLGKQGVQLGDREATRSIMITHALRSLAGKNGHFLSSAAFYKAKLV